MAKKSKAFLLVGLLLAICLIADVAFRNPLIARHMESRLASALETRGLKVAESASVCGKLSGNGNGLQFFAVCLVKCENPEALEEIKAALTGSYELVDYRRQRDALVSMDINEHTPITLGAQYDWQEPWYIVYFLESQHPAAHPLDLRGH